VLAIINMPTGNEAESQAVVTLQYAALVDRLIMMMTQK
jgi:hypothetical protein